MIKITNATEILISMKEDFSDATITFVRGKHSKAILHSVAKFIASESNQAVYNFKPGPEFKMNSAGACLRAAEIVITSLSDKQSAKIAVRHFIRDSTDEIRKEVYCNYRPKPDECFMVNKEMTPAFIYMSAVFGRISKMANEEKEEGA